jgi:hypothetical protein
MRIRHLNRRTRKRMPKVWQDCAPRPAHEDGSNRTKKRQQRLFDRRVSAVLRDSRLGRQMMKSIPQEEIDAIIEPVTCDTGMKLKKTIRSSGRVKVKIFADTAVEEDVVIDLREGSEDMAYFSDSLRVSYI